MTRALILIPFLVSFFSANSQSTLYNLENKEEEARALNWSQADDIFKETTIPDKWKDESAVIIARSNYLEYKKVILVAQVQQIHHFHERIKLLDKKAVEKYTTFTFSGSYRSGTNSNYTFAGFKIIKPDGREIIVTQNEGVAENLKAGGNQMNRLKVALPNLEVGDILDYYIDNEQLSYSGGYHRFDPAIFQLTANYPIMKYRLEFDVMRKCYINFKSLNGAPELSLKEGEDKKKFYLETSNLEKINTPRWFNVNTELPTVKFKVVYSSNSAVSPFLGTPGVIKNNVTKSEIKTLVNYSFANQYLGKAYKADIKKTKKTIPNELERAKNAYYELRNTVGVQNIETTIVKGTNHVYNYGWYNFLGKLSQAYSFLGIKHEILITVPREIGSIDDLILEEELSLAIRVSRGKDQFYIGSFNNCALFGEIDPTIEDQQAFGLLKGPGIYNSYLTETKIHISPSDSNVVHTNLELSIIDGTINANMNRTVSGISKYKWQEQLVSAEDIIEDEKAKYGIEEPYFSTTSKKIENAKIRLENIEKFEKKRLEGLKPSLVTELELEIDTVTNFNLISTGRMEKNPDLIYSLDFATKECIKKAGPNYIVELGKFIGSQTKITEEFRERPFDIVMPYARQYSENLRLHLPDGYSVSGIENFQFNVTNETGSFVSTAELEDNELVIRATKTYNHNKETADKWNLMLEFLDAASEFNESKILLKKI